MTPHKTCGGECGRTEGERDKADRLALLEERRAVFVNRGRRALLARLLSAGTATADDVRASVVLPEGIDPRCFGTVPGPLAKAGIIGLDGYTKTARPERHASVTGLWRLADPQAARLWLDEHPDCPDPLPDDGGRTGALFDLFGEKPLEKQRPAAFLAEPVGH
jgi:hypothetical protein